MTECTIPDCQEPAIHPEIPLCHAHAVDTIIATVQAVTLCAPLIVVSSLILSLTLAICAVRLTSGLLNHWDRQDSLRAMR